MELFNFVGLPGTRSEDVKGLRFQVLVVSISTFRCKFFCQGGGVTVKGVGWANPRVFRNMLDASK